MGLCTEHLCWPVRTGKPLRLRKTKTRPQGVGLFVCFMVLAWTGNIRAGKNQQLSVYWVNIFFLYTLIPCYLIVAAWPGPKLIFLSANPIIDIQLVFNFDQSHQGSQGTFSVLGTFRGLSFNCVLKRPRHAWSHVDAGINPRFEKDANRICSKVSLE